MKFSVLSAATKPLRLAILRLAIRVVEKSGLAVVQVKRSDGAVYMIGATGSYVRFDKVKQKA